MVRYLAFGQFDVIFMMKMRHESQIKLKIKNKGYE